MTVRPPQWTRPAPTTGPTARPCSPNSPTSAPSTPRRWPAAARSTSPRHRGRGKLLARERIELVSTPTRPSWSRSPPAAWGSEYAVGASLVTGIGTVEGRGVPDHPANDRPSAAVPVTLVAEEGPARQRHRARQPAALRQPCWSSPGAPTCRRIVEHLHPGRRDLQGHHPAVGGRHPTPSPSSSAIPRPPGARTSPAAPDHVIDGSSANVLGGPLVKMATGEESDDESLGGAEMHARVSGLADHFAVDEPDALRQARRVVARLNHRKAHPDPQPSTPKYDPEELLGIVPGDLKTPSTRARSSPGSSTPPTSTSSSRCTGRA